MCTGKYNDLQSWKPSISPLADLSKDLSFITHLDMSKLSNDLTFKAPQSDISYLEELSVPQCSRIEKHSCDRDCDCGCSLVAAELEGVKLDIAIMLSTFGSRISNIESKMSANVNEACEKDEISKLKDDLSNERNRYKLLELKMLEVVEEKNCEIQNLESSIKCPTKLNNNQ